MEDLRSKIEKEIREKELMWHEPIARHTTISRPVKAYVWECSVCGFTIKSLYKEIVLKEALQHVKTHMEEK